MGDNYWSRADSELTFKWMEPRLTEEHWIYHYKPTATGKLHCSTVVPIILKLCCFTGRRALFESPSNCVATIPWHKRHPVRLIQIFGGGALGIKRPFPCTASIHTKTIRSDSTMKAEDLRGRGKYDWLALPASWSGCKVNACYFLTTVDTEKNLVGTITSFVDFLHG